MGVTETRHNTHVNVRRCAGGFVRLRGRFLDAVGSQLLRGVMGDKEKRCDGGLFDTS